MTGTAVIAGTSAGCLIWEKPIGDVPPIGRKPFGEKKIASKLTAALINSPILFRPIPFSRKQRESSSILFVGG